MPTDSQIFLRAWNDFRATLGYGHLTDEDRVKAVQLARYDHLQDGIDYLATPCPEPAPAPTPTPAPAPQSIIPASATLLKHTDFADATYQGWYPLVIPGRDSFGTDNGVTYWRSEVRNGDVEPNTGNCRCQLNSDNLPQGEYWLRYVIRHVEGFPGNDWCLTHQWHESPGIGPVDLAAFVEKGPTVHLHGEKIDAPFRTPVLDSDWHEFVYHIAFGSNGFAEQWFDGEHLGRVEGVTCSTATWYPNVGIYRAAATTSGTMVADYSLIEIYRA